MTSQAGHQGSGIGVKDPYLWLVIPALLLSIREASRVGVAGHGDDAPVRREGDRIDVAREAVNRVTKRAAIHVPDSESVIIAGAGQQSSVR